MGVPIRQQISLAGYIAKQKLRGRRRYPLVLMLEPLFQCNLACAGCGKIDYPPEVLARRLSLADCLAAVEECGAPVVSIAGGEPLIHPEMPAIVQAILARRRFVYLCTNALLLRQRLAEYRPSPYLTLSIHLDGLRERHDTAVCRAGVFDRAVAAIREARERGFRVNVNSTLFAGEQAAEYARFLDFCNELDVEGVTLSPGFDYAAAPQQEQFLQRQAGKRLLRAIFRLGRGRKWRLNHSPLYLDFLAGNQSYQCTPWGNPTRNIFGWQRPCYLLADGHAESFRALLEETDWSAYGVGQHPQCHNCMAHCGFEASAVDDALRRPLKALGVMLGGPRTEGPMAPEPIHPVEPAPSARRPGDEPLTERA